MLKNYLKVAFRNLSRYKGYTALNVAGLSVGIACCLLAFLYVQDELQFDGFHEHSDRIYRVTAERTIPQEQEGRFTQMPGPLGPALVNEFPEVQTATRLLANIGRMTVERGDARFYVGDYLFAEPSFFEVFSFGLRQGDPRTALEAPGSVVLTQEAARTYFGEEDPMGQTISNAAFGDMLVTGVLERLPGNSHLGFSMIFSVNTLEGWPSLANNWNSAAFITYVVLNDPAAAAELEPELPAFLRQYDIGDEPGTWSLGLQPLRDIHFDSADIEGELNYAEGDITYLYVFSAIGLFILLIACINYMNLATARSMRRAREVGMRKVVGAHRSQLVAQFLSESVLVVLTAFVVGLVLCQIALPFFNTVMQKEMVFNLPGNLLVLGVLAMVAVGVGLVSGSYPALVLSRFVPAAVLKGTLSGASGPSRLRSGLVVTQFALSSALIVATLVVQQQLHYIQNTRLGFDEEQLVVIDINNGDVRRDFKTVKEELARIPVVTAVSVSSRVPGDWKGLTESEVTPANRPEAGPTPVTFMRIDEDFLDTYEVALIEGRNFTPADSASVLLNEAAARLLGWDDPVGQQIDFPGSNFRAEVVGVVGDFHFRSLHEEIGPLVLGYQNNRPPVIDYFTVRIVGGDVPATLAQLREVGERFDPLNPFEYNFLDERLNDFYQAEQRVRSIAGAGAFIAIVIACLGLLGLAAFTIERRTKEIGIRKVLGASISGIVVLITKDFFQLVLLGVVLAAPFTYLLMSRWLEGFAYRIDLHWSLFLLTAVVAGAVALLTIGYQSIKAALADPVKSLRYE
jgi:putative ABC transport system permease protein